MLIRELIAQSVITAIRAAQAEGALPAFEVPPVNVEHPRDPRLGHYATNIALHLARAAKLPRRALQRSSRALWITQRSPQRR